MVPWSAIFSTPVPECEKESPLWKVFRGCGHSFHIECVLLDISVCQICQSALLTKLEVLGKVANEAVFNHDLRATLQENEDEAEDTQSDHESETDDDDDKHEIQPEDGKLNIDTLLQQIRHWKGH